MAAKKSTKDDDTNITEPQGVERDVEDEMAEDNPTAKEVAKADDEPKPMTFTIEVDGEEIELTDCYRKDKAPGEFVLVGREEYAEKYLPSLLEKLIGEEQMFMLLDKGMSLDELNAVPKAWMKARRLGK